MTLTHPTDRAGKVLAIGCRVRVEYERGSVRFVRHGLVTALFAGIDGGKANARVTFACNSEMIVDGSECEMVA